MIQYADWNPGGVICPSFALNGLSGTFSPTAGTENRSPVRGGGTGAGTADREGEGDGDGVIVGVVVVVGVGDGVVVGGSILTGSCVTVFPSMVRAAAALGEDEPVALWNETSPAIPATVRHAAEATASNTTGMVGRLPHHPFG